MDCFLFLLSNTIQAPSRSFGKAERKCSLEIGVLPGSPFAMQSDIMSGKASGVMTEERLLFAVFLTQEIKINNWKKVDF